MGIFDKLFKKNISEEKLNEFRIRLSNVLFQ